MKLLLFDIDMTLVSTGGAGLRALDSAFEVVFGSRGALEGVRPHGKTDPAIIREACLRRGLDIRHETRSRILDLYVGFLEAEVRASGSYRVLPGVQELLDRMSGPEVVAGLATGNIESGARIKLKRGGLNPYFKFGGFGSDSEDRAELVRAAARRGQQWSGVRIPPSSTFVIGDTPMDIAAGRAAGFQTIGVATGTYTADELERAGADSVVPDLLEGRDQFLRSTRIV